MGPRKGSSNGHPERKKHNRSKEPSGSDDSGTEREDARTCKGDRKAKAISHRVV